MTDYGRQCGFAGCQKGVRTRNAIYCAKHYLKVWRTGTTEPLAKMPWRERLAAIIAAHSADECWPWTGRLDRDGYGRAGGNKAAYRLAYEHLVAPIPEGLEIDHLCRNRACVNPSHMEPVTRRANAQRVRRDAS